MQTQSESRAAAAAAARRRRAIDFQHPAPAPSSKVHFELAAARGDKCTTRLFSYFSYLRKRPIHFNGSQISGGELGFLNRQEQLRFSFLVFLAKFKLHLRLRRQTHTRPSCIHIYIEYFSDTNDPHVGFVISSSE